MIVEQRWVIGTGEDCEVRVTDEYASRHHCEVARTADGLFFVHDLGSTNGTRIRRGSVTVNAWSWTPIVPGDVLIVGRSEMPWRASADHATGRAPLHGPLHHRSF